jgi:hypothetical protein
MVWGLQIATGGHRSRGCRPGKSLGVVVFSIFLGQVNHSVRSASFWNCDMSGPCDEKRTKHSEISEDRWMGTGGLMCRGVDVRTPNSELINCYR